MIVIIIEDYAHLLGNDKGALNAMVSTTAGYTASSFDFLPSVRLTKVALDSTIRTKPEQKEPLFINGKINVESEASKISLAIFDAFVTLAEQRGHIPVIIVFPAKPEPSKWIQKGNRPSQAIVNELVPKGYNVIDVFDVLQEYFTSSPTEDLYMNSHFSPESNKRIAEAILQELKKSGLLLEIPSPL